MNDAATICTERLDLIAMTPAFLRASLDRQRERAEAILGVPLPSDWPHIPEVLRMRLGQLEADPGLQPWLLRAIALRESRMMVGYTGFHTAPGAEYLKPWRPAGVEFGFTVFPQYRRRGIAREASLGLMKWAGEVHGVRSFVTSVSITNVASRSLVTSLGFVRVDTQIDEEDGPEDIFVLDI